MNNSTYECTLCVCVCACNTYDNIYIQRLAADTRVAIYYHDDINCVCMRIGSNIAVYSARAFKSFCVYVPTRP